MKMLSVIVAVTAVAGALACGKDDNAGGLPAASEWNSPTEPGVSGGVSGGVPGAEHPGPSGHGELPPGHPPMGGDHGAGSVPDLPAPDPNRKIDETKFVKGTIKATAETRPLIKSSSAIFLSARVVDPKTGKAAPGMMPLAVDMMEKAMVPAPFALSDSKAMVDGTQLRGDVLVKAHVSQTRNAGPPVPGDVIGTKIVKIPAENVEIVLDTIIK